MGQVVLRQVVLKTSCSEKPPISKQGWNLHPTGYRSSATESSGDREVALVAVEPWQLVAPIPKTKRLLPVIVVVYATLYYRTGCETRLPDLTLLRVSAAVETQKIPVPDRPIPARKLHPGDRPPPEGTTVLKTLSISGNAVGDRLVA